MSSTIDDYRHQVTIWVCPMEIFVKPKGKRSHLNAADPPAPDSPTDSKETKVYDVWVKDNSTIMTWILNSCETRISSTLLRLKTAKEMWDQLATIYSHGQNPKKMYDLNKQLTHLQLSSTSTLKD